MVRNAGGQGLVWLEMQVDTDKCDKKCRWTGISVVINAGGQ